MNNISGIVKSARKIMRQDTGTGSEGIVRECVCKLCDHSGTLG